MASVGGGVASSSTTDAQEMEERRLKRRLSNRESARRTRARKQQQVKELEAEAEALRGKKRGLEEAVRAAARCCAAVEAQNAVLRARALELGGRLHSLADLLLRCKDDTSISISGTLVPMQQQHITASPDMSTWYH